MEGSTKKLQAQGQFGVVGPPQQAVLLREVPGLPNSLT